MPDKDDSASQAGSHARPIKVRRRWTAAEAFLSWVLLLATASPSLASDFVSVSESAPPHRLIFGTITLPGEGRTGRFIVLESQAVTVKYEDYAVAFKAAFDASDPDTVLWEPHEILPSGELAPWLFDAPGRSGIGEQTNFIFGPAEPFEFTIRLDAISSVHIGQALELSAEGCCLTCGPVTVCGQCVTLWCGHCCSRMPSEDGLMGLFGEDCVAGPRSRDGVVGPLGEDRIVERLGPENCRNLPESGARFPAELTLPLANICSDLKMGGFEANAPSRPGRRTE